MILGAALRWCISVFILLGLMLRSRPLLLYAEACDVIPHSCDSIVLCWMDAVALKPIAYVVAQASAHQTYK